MTRPLNRTQILENRAFLRALRRTGNAREAARALGAHRAKFTKRRAAHSSFAAEWDAALAVAHARLKLPSRSREGSGEGVSASAPHAVRLANGRLQLRRAGVRRLTRAAEQAFLAALSATANVRLSEAAAGFSHAAFYARRKASPAFAREMKLALEMGYERIELALLESFLPESHSDDAWRMGDNEPPPIPKMSPDQALQLLYLHQKQVRLEAEPEFARQRRGEPIEVWRGRMILVAEARLEAEREKFRVAEATRAAARCAPSPHEPEPPVLPALEQVTGWSKVRREPHAGSGAADETATARPASARPTSDDAGFAGGGLARHPGRALIGGWRLGDWAER